MFHFSSLKRMIFSPHTHTQFHRFEIRVNEKSWRNEKDAIEFSNPLLQIWNRFVLISEIVTLRKNRVHIDFFVSILFMCLVIHSE